MTSPRVLLTGFGPFPGVADNPSGRLVESLATRSAFFGCAVQGTVLPTEWKTVSTLAPRLHRDLQPRVTIHFGVSACSKALRIERSAHNAVDGREDACGTQLLACTISDGGAERLDTRLPVKALAAHLRAKGHAARLSSSCGRYLCNYVYYHSLTRTALEGGDALFIHVPPTRARGGTVSEDVLHQAAEDAVQFVIDAVATRPAERQAHGPIAERRV
jgi:pyroglutamyl-peptidase